VAPWLHKGVKAQRDDHVTTLLPWL